MVLFHYRKRCGETQTIFKLTSIFIIVAECSPFHFFWHRNRCQRKKLVNFVGFCKLGAIFDFAKKFFRQIARTDVVGARHYEEVRHLSLCCSREPFQAPWIKMLNGTVWKLLYYYSFWIDIIIFWTFYSNKCSWCASISRIHRWWSGDRNYHSLEKTNF